MTGKIPIRDDKQYKQQAIEFDLKKFKSRFIWHRWLSTFAFRIQKWFCLKVIAAKSNMIRNKLGLVMGICITLIAFKLFARESVAFYTKQDFLFHIDRYHFFWIERASISITWNRGQCGAILTSQKFLNELSFCRRQPRLVTYATEISLARSLVASQQKKKNSFFNIEVAHIRPMLPSVLCNFVSEIKAFFIGAISQFVFHLVDW